MANNRIAVVFLTIIFCSVLLTGCKDSEKEKALEEVSNPKAQLSKAEKHLVANNSDEFWCTTESGKTCRVR